MNEPSKNPNETRDSAAEMEKKIPVEPFPMDALYLQGPPWRLHVKRGVYRFKTHEEANAHMDKILKDSGLPKT